MAASHGWELIDAERKREIIAAICDDAVPRGPLHVELDLTDRCNVACYFCNQQDVRTRQQLPLERIADLLDELWPAGLPSGARPRRPPPPLPPPTPTPPPP